MNIFDNARTFQYFSDVVGTLGKNDRGTFLDQVLNCYHSYKVMNEDKITMDDISKVLVDNKFIRTASSQ